jgi:hypothetical protein
MPPTDWNTTFVFVGAGIALGWILAWRLSARLDASQRILSTDCDERELLARRDALLTCLCEIGGVSSISEERRALEIECAQVLRALDEHAKHGAPVAGLPQRLRSDTAWIAWMWGAGLAVVVMVSSLAIPRVGRDRALSRSRTAPQGEIEMLREAVRADPLDLDARVEFAQACLKQHELVEAMEQTRFVLERRPDDPRALSFQALVRFSRGEIAEAREMMRRAVSLAPQWLDGWIHLIFLEIRAGRRAEAERMVAEAARRHPDRADELRGLLREFDASGAPARPEGDRSQGIGGRVGLSPELRGQLPSGGVIFLVVRSAESRAGAPLAVQRLSTDSLPATFWIDSSASMIGSPLPPRVGIEARFDSDGDPVTRDPEALWARVDNVALGASDLRLELRRHVADTKTTPASER